MGVQQTDVWVMLKHKHDFPEARPREELIEAFFETPERETVLGTYAIDQLGETTLERVSGYELARGEARPVTVLEAGG